MHTPLKNSFSLCILPKHGIVYFCLIFHVSLIFFSNSYNTGQASSKLQYYDGFINLTYPNGDLYRSNISRTTEIAFLCDRDAGIGKPEFVTEDHGYNFKWFTSYACPNPPVECTVTDTIRNKQYDLSGLV